MQQARVTHLISAVFLLVAATSCSRVPSSAYEWNPALANAKGSMDAVIRGLPFGTEVFRAQFPSKQEGITLSNDHALFPFVDDPSLRSEQPYTWARVMYDERPGRRGDEEQPRYSLVYGALGKQNVGAGSKDSSYSGSPGFLSGDMQRRLNFDMCRVQGLLRPEEPAQVYLAKGSVSSLDLGLAAALAQAMGPKPQYLNLVYPRRNLYLELAVVDDGDYGDCEEATTGALPTVKGDRDSVAWKKILQALQAMGFSDLAVQKGE